MKKIVAVVFALVLFVGLGIAVYIISQRTTFFGEASPGRAPENIKITNISDNAFSVSWVTPSKISIGYVVYGTNTSLGAVANDDRDSVGQASYFTHHVTLKDLRPATVYYFKIASEDKQYDSGGKPFEVKTALTTNETPPLPDTAFGKVNPAGTDTLVYVNFENASPLSTYTKSDGNWVITLNNARNASLSGYFVVGQETRVSLSATNGKKTSHGSFTAANKSPVPDITLGQNIVLAVDSSQVSAQGQDVQLAVGETQSNLSPSPSPTVRASSSPSPTLSTAPSKVLPTPKATVAASASALPVAGVFANTLYLVFAGVILVSFGVYGIKAVS